MYLNTAKQDVFFVPDYKRMATPEPDSFQRHEWGIKNKYLKWFFNKIFNFMLKKGYFKQKEIIETSIQVERRTIDLDKLDYQISQNKQAIEMIYNKRVETIIVGADIMRKFMSGDPYKMGMVELDMGNRVSNYSSYTRNRPTGFGLEPHFERVRYSGLNIICIPWFEGFLLIPKQESY